MVFKKAKLRFLLFNLKLKYQPWGRKQTVNNRNDQPCKNEKGLWTQETHKKLSEDGKDSEDYTSGGTNKISDRVET